MTNLRKSNGMKIVFLALFLLAGTGISYASGGGGGEAPHFDGIKELMRIFNFVFVVAVLYLLLSGIVRKFFKSRTDGIVTMISDTEASNHEAQKKLEALEKRSEEIDKEIALIRENARKEGEFIYQEILKTAKEDASKIIKKAELDILVETKKARAALKKEASALALEVAEKRLKKEITQKDQKNSIRNYLNTVEV
ncbi:MAG: ATP synthase F0 subunit B [Nitrospinota bacterium]